MLDTAFRFLTLVDNLFWGYGAFVLIILLGSYLSVKYFFFQLKYLPSIAKDFFENVRAAHNVRDAKKTTSFKASFLAFGFSLGGMIEIGNIVGIVTAIQLGGPGALFWIWVTGIVGAIVKYGEIYLGFKYRVANKRGGYDGGPMYFLKAAFKSPFIPMMAATLLCVYAVDIYQFSIVTDSLSTQWDLNKYLVAICVLILVFYISLGGIKRMLLISSWTMPLLIIGYMTLALWILIHEAALLPSIFSTVLRSAFTGHAAVGGFAGSTMLMAIQYGMARAAYSADIGSGFDSIIQSELTQTSAQKQARFAILSVFIDNFICTVTILVVLVSGLWNVDSLSGSELIQEALSSYFPFVKRYMPYFLSLVGFTTIITYFSAGMKCAQYLLPKHGTLLYILYGTVSLFFSTFLYQGQALLLMSIAGASVLIINLLGLFLLRKEILFETPNDAKIVHFNFKHFITKATKLKN